MSRRNRVALKTTIWVVCLLPLAILAYRGWTDDLTANPISFITNWLGDWTFRILLTALSPGGQVSQFPRQLPGER